MARRLVTEYSRTPEVRYPVALEECYELLDWAVSRADELGLDAGRVAVAGDCAGATPAAAVTMLAKSRGGPRLSAQLLYYPLTDSRCDSPSQWQFATGHLLTRRALRTYWGRYVTDPALRCEPTASPLWARTGNLVRLPSALVVVTAEADVARDEGEQYARNLRAAGVEASAVPVPRHDPRLRGAARPARPARPARQRAHSGSSRDRLRLPAGPVALKRAVRAEDQSTD